MHHAFGGFLFGQRIGFPEGIVAIGVRAERVNPRAGIPTVTAEATIVSSVRSRPGLYPPSRRLAPVDALFNRQIEKTAA
jgi:hypothetical protein